MDLRLEVFQVQAESGAAWPKNMYKTTQMQKSPPGSLLWHLLWESS